MKTPLLLALLSSPAFGAWTLIDNFESGSLASWTLTGTTATSTIGIVNAPEAGVSSNVLRLRQTGTATDMFGRIALPAPIPNTSTAATVYFRMFLGATSTARNLVSGLAETPTSAYNDYAAVTRLSSTGLDTYHGNGTGGAAAGGGYLTVDSTVALGTWYDVWMVINNSADTYQMYYSEGGGTPVLATTSGSLSTFGLRNGGSEAISGFMVAGSSPTGTLGYIDDIYLDLAGSNLALPVPEPAAATFAGLAGLALLRRRRCCR